MTIVYTLDQIKDALAGVDLLPAIEHGFVRLSRGDVIVPPVGELLFQDPPGDVHIKYGYVRGGDRYLVKIASGFYRNPTLGLNPNPGCMMLASQRTGEIEAVLLEEGFLTNLRTALAGAVAAKHLANRPVTRIGVIGAGVQARFQLDALKPITDCRDVILWARRDDAAARLKDDLDRNGFRAVIGGSPREVATAPLIVTTTAAESPLLDAGMIAPGTHITAMGSDTEHKTELAPDILRKADLVVTDSRAQASLRGEISHALATGDVDLAEVVELGELIAQPSRGRRSADDITVADLTGVAVQDIAVADAALAALTARAARPLP